MGMDDDKIHKKTCDSQPLMQACLNRTVIFLWKNKAGKKQRKLLQLNFYPKFSVNR
jgi:hypothetical protein